MEEKQDINTEKQILEAAKRVFIHKGMAGARMQEIADEAGINKSLLHYYYRSKEKLFDAVFRSVFFTFFPHFDTILLSDASLFDKIRKFCDMYLDVLMKNPFIPLFILHELNNDSQKLTAYIKQIGINPKAFVVQVKKEIEKGIIRPVDPRQLIINMLSMCVFPIAGRPLIQAIVFNDNTAEYDRFLETRKKEIPDFIIHSIKAK